MDSTSAAKCVLCGGQVEETAAQLVEEFRGHETVVRGVTRHRCLECGEEFYSLGAASTIAAEQRRQARELEGLLQPEEIRAIRTSLGMSQAKFEQYLGVGPKTVVRWENGTVFQSKAVDRLIRLVGAVPQAAAYLREMGTPQKPARA